MINIIGWQIEGNINKNEKRNGEMKKWFCLVLYREVTATATAIGAPISFGGGIR